MGEKTFVDDIVKHSVSEQEISLGTPTAEHLHLSY